MLRCRRSGVWYRGMWTPERVCSPRARSLPTGGKPAKVVEESRGTSDKARDVAVIRHDAEWAWAVGLTGLQMRQQ